MEACAKKHALSKSALHTSCLVMLSSTHRASPGMHVSRSQGFQPALRPQICIKH
jgi:hypothetical protein